MPENTVHLEIGLGTDGSLMSIDDVPSGKTNLLCPFCNGSLLAKKGKILQHHFSHTGETCIGVHNLTPLPAFDDFTLQLTPRELETYQYLWEKSKQGQYGLDNVPTSFVEKGLFKENPFNPGGLYEFTHKGKVPAAGLSMYLFSKLHTDLLLDTHTLLSESANDSQDHITALTIYRAQLKRVYQQHLYFLKIEADDQVLHKIGITTRSLEMRIPEIQRDLLNHYSTVKITPIAFKEHRGHCERYFKFMNAPHNVQIGSLTEYFAFTPDKLKKVSRDLKRIPTREFTDTENKILNNWWAKESKRIAAVRKGMALAKAAGQTNLGRPKGSHEDLDLYLSKPKNKEIAALLEEKVSIRNIAKIVGASDKTVQRVKRCLKELD